MISSSEELRVFSHYGFAFSKQNEKIGIINLKCCLKDGQEEKTYIISPCKEDKVAILEFAVNTLLANQGYQALSLNFDFYVNDSKENKPMESAEEISKYFDKPLVQDQIHILIKPKNN